MISSAAALYFRSSWLSILNEHPIRPVNYIRLEPIRPARWKEPKNPIDSLALPIHLPSRLISNLRIPIMSRIARSKWVFPFPLFLFLPPNNSISPSSAGEWSICAIVHRSDHHVSHNSIGPASPWFICIRQFICPQSIMEYGTHLLIGSVEASTL